MYMMSSLIHPNVKSIIHLDLLTSFIALLIQLDTQYAVKIDAYHSSSDHRKLAVWSKDRLSRAIKGENEHKHKQT
ncbi:hypothetical protein PDE_00960 [Penicillium oxalicum 114-2]|uniref:Uncharacterized protein n=1 Tax=Penicillium oxalicum (strain 114-2 / CGMCC 5302) TaxID=933388 RepID=S7Z787_PENO1|nr:hypothetical protein PDE_00960 [Penicillium oxalicum 114-2]